MKTRIIRRALVTGGAGFIGSHIVRRLLAQGVEVRVLDNLSSGYASNLEGLPVMLIEGDVRSAESVREAMASCDTVFHLAASVGNKRSIDDPLTDSAVNVLGTLNVLEAARATGAGKVVFSSSAGIFGELKTLPIREDHPVEPDSPYGASKLGAEKMCLAYAKLYPLECVCLRYFNVYGTNQRFDAYGNVIPIFAHRLFSGEPITIFGDGEQTRDFISGEDVAQANVAAASTAEVSGAFNIGSGTRITINELAKMMQRISDSDVQIVHGAPRPGDVRHSLADISAASAAFGFKPSRELEEGLTEYLTWYRQDVGRHQAAV